MLWHGRGWGAQSPGLHTFLLISGGLLWPVVSRFLRCNRQKGSTELRQARYHKTTYPQGMPDVQSWWNFLFYGFNLFMSKVIEDFVRLILPKTAVGKPSPIRGHMVAQQDAVNSFPGLKFTPSLCFLDRFSQWLPWNKQLWDAECEN